MNSIKFLKVALIWLLFLNGKVDKFIKYCGADNSVQTGMYINTIEVFLTERCGDFVVRRNHRATLRRVDDGPSQSDTAQHLHRAQVL